MSAPSPPPSANRSAITARGGLSGSGVTLSWFDNASAYARARSGEILVVCHDVTARARQL